MANGRSPLSADLPLDIDPLKSQLSIEGIIVDGKMDWRSVTYYPDVSQMGGGGGGGMGFYQLNLNGTPIPFPTTTPIRTSYTQAEIASFLKHRVQSGDTLTQIAATYKVSIDDILSRSTTYLTQIYPRDSSL
jgi:hypothetical protein